MCGIVGFYSYKSTVDKARLEAACLVMQHRGPNASNVYFDNDVGLGHRRLSIIDLSEAANQPMSDVTGQVVLVYNGELYNHKELRQQLMDRGCKFATNSDTEVLLQMYIEYGEQCLSY